MDLKYFNEKCELYETENATLKSNKLSSIETNDKIRELYQENFVLHEKNNELLDKLERLSQDNVDYGRKLKKLEEKLDNEKSMDNMIKTGNFANNNNSNFNASNNKIGGSDNSESFANTHKDNNKEKK